MDGPTPQHSEDDRASNWGLATGECASANMKRFDHLGLALTLRFKRYLRHVFGERRVRHIKRWRIHILLRLGHNSAAYLAMGDLDRQIAIRVKQGKGFFVEFGAFDGLQYSNTFALARLRGWQGPLIEASPELARECARNRPEATVINCALVSPDRAGTSVSLHYAGLMSVVAEADGLSYAQERHVAAGKWLQGTKSHTERIRGMTLTAVFDACGVTDVDFMSVDVEGMELDVLGGLDFTKYAPAILLVETESPDEVTDFLSPWYRLEAKASHHDYFYVRWQDSEGHHGRTPES